MLDTKYQQQLKGLVISNMGDVRRPEGLFRRGREIHPRRRSGAILMAVATPPARAIYREWGYRVAGTVFIEPCASTHSPLIRTTQVPVRALPFHPSGRNPMSAPEITALESRRVCAEARMPVS